MNSSCLFVDNYFIFSLIGKPNPHAGLEESISKFNSLINNWCFFYSTIYWPGSAYSYFIYLKACLIIPFVTKEVIFAKLGSNFQFGGCAAETALFPSISTIFYLKKYQTLVQLKILSTISSGYLGMRISDLVMKGLDEINETYWGETEILGTSKFYGGYNAII